MIQVSSFLQHEQQLGKQLNSALVEHKRADFSLMLAMLTENVLAHSQFKLPKVNQIKAPETEDELRARLAVPATQALAITEPKQYQQANNSALLPDLLSSIRLKQFLQNSPLAERNNKQYIDDEIWQNTSIDCQARNGHWQHQTSNTSLNESTNTAEFDANGWLDQVIPNSLALI